jgi:large subunit ribosomal protein L18e
MKVTGPAKLETKKIIAELEKHYRKSKEAIWLDLAERIAKPRRQRVSVNIWKIEKLAKIIEKKILVVPGKVLGFGELTRPVHVVALEYSTDAKKKILEKGNAMTLREAIEKKIKPKEMAIVK